MVFAGRLDLDVVANGMGNDIEASGVANADVLASLQAEIAQMRIEMQAQLASQQDIIGGVREENQLLFAAALRKPHRARRRPSVRGEAPAVRIQEPPLSPRAPGK